MAVNFEQRIARLREKIESRRQEEERRLLREKELSTQLYSVVEELGKKAAGVNGIPLRVYDESPQTGKEYPRPGRAMVYWRRLVSGADGRGGPGAELSLAFRDDYDEDLSFELLSYRFFRRDGKTFYAAQRHGVDGETEFRTEPEQGFVMTYEERILAEIIGVVEEMADVETKNG